MNSSVVLNKEAPAAITLSAGPPQHRLELHALVPIKTVSLNQSGRQTHWGQRARRAKKEREAVGWALKPYTQHRLLVPCAVTLMRIAPSGGLDSDNLAGSFKATRDAVAEWLGVDDADPRVTWAYTQGRSSAKGVRGYAVSIVMRWPNA
jgi:hypothetical protein